jgi:hypothetical protein
MNNVDNEHLASAKKKTLAQWYSALQAFQNSLRI